MGKFNCKDCGKETIFDRYRTSIVNGNPVYKDKNGRDLKCSSCSSSNLEFIKDPDGGLCTNFGRFNSMSADDKKRMLKKRADDNFKGSVKEQHDHIHKTAVKKMLNK
jgi:DNA-directed RNA polymerase subunit RPC12/RpoP